MIYLNARRRFVQDKLLNLHSNDVGRNFILDHDAFLRQARDFVHIPVPVHHHSAAKSVNITAAINITAAKTVSITAAINITAAKSINITITKL